MAFAFLVETGVGLAEANSYASVEFADTYLSINVQQFAAWDALSPTEKQHLLARASQYLDRMIRWNGTKVVEDSGLRWPRAEVYNTDCYLIPDTVIPRELMEAAVELATYFNQQDLTRRVAGSGELEELHVDVIELHYSEAPEQEVVPAWVLALIDGLGVLKTKPGRANRFRKIVRT